MGLTVVNALFSNSNVHFATIMTFTFIEHCHSDRCRCRHRPRYYHWGTAEFRIFVTLKCLNSLILITSGKSHAPHSSGECECVCEYSIGVSVQTAECSLFYAPVISGNHFQIVQFQDLSINFNQRQRDEERCKLKNEDLRDKIETEVTWNGVKLKYAHPFFRRPSLQ